MSKIDSSAMKLKFNYEGAGTRMNTATQAAGICGGPPAITVEWIARGGEIEVESLITKRIRLRPMVNLGRFTAFGEQGEIPILVLGGSRNQGALDVVRGVMQAGAAGVFFGRNVFQSEDMEGFLKEARSILDGAEALGKRK